MHKKLTNTGDIFNIEGVLLTSEPLWRHTTFRVGGPADYYAVPSGEEDLAALVNGAREAGLPLFILGGGSNLLVADRGIRGLVVDMKEFSEFQAVEEGGERILVLGAGLDITDAAWKAGSAGLAGLEYFFGMPGSVGGAVWMNARCYDGEIADSFAWAEVMDRNGRIRKVGRKDEDWAYKKSPFQGSSDTILRAAFRMNADDSEALRSFMTEKRNDRESKGHFRSPCAGSAFKNNRSFGEPSGALIDKAGLKGFRIGGAAVSGWHGNIIINDRGAKASEIKELLENVSARVEEKTGFRMEAEVICVGEW